MIVLCGGSASGKSEITKHFINEFNFETIITYTTRPCRDGEISGVDYNFVKYEDFYEMEKQGFFAETSYYNNWCYGSAKSDYLGDTMNKIVILTPHGIRQLKKQGDINSLFTVFLDSDRRQRLIRQLLRGDNIEEAYRRNLSDVGQFDGIEDDVDYIAYNWMASHEMKNLKTIPEISREILEEYIERLGHTVNIKDGIDLMD